MMTSQWNWTRRLTQNIWCVAHSMYCRVRKYIFIRAFLKPISKRCTPNFRTENMVSFKEVWQSNEFETFFVFSTIRLKSEVTGAVGPATLLKKRLWHRCFPVNFAKFLRTLFFHRTPLVAASEVNLFVREFSEVFYFPSLLRLFSQ